MTYSADIFPLLSMRPAIQLQVLDTRGNKHALALATDVLLYFTVPPKANPKASPWTSGSSIQSYSWLYQP